jgi:hypothetical protein
MALKYTPTEKHIVKIGSKEIEFTPWTTKNEREYLQLLENEKIEVTDKTIYDTLIAPCIKDKNLVLSSDEQKLLMIEIRKESIGKTFKDEHECSNCKEKVEVEFNIDDLIDYRPSKWKPIPVENMVFTLGDIRTNKEKSLLNIDKGIVNYIYTDFMLHIHSIEIDGELNNKFTFKELAEFIDSLPAKIFDEVFEKYQEQIDDLNLIVNKWKCPKCKKTSDIKYETIPGFLWV